MGPRTGDGDYASIDPAALRGAADSLQRSVDNVHSHVPGLQAEFGRLGVDAAKLGTLTQIASAISDLIPQLRRRQSMAEQLVAEAPANGKVAYFQGDLLGQFQTVAAATAQAHIDAEQVNHARDHKQPVPQSVYDHLQKYGYDPDYAAAFVNDIGTKGVTWLLVDMHYTDDPGEKPDETKLRALGTTLATASYRVNFDSKYLHDINMNLRDLDISTNAVGSVSLFAPMLNYGVWSEKSLDNIADLVLNKDGKINVDTTGPIDGDAVKFVFTGLSHNGIAAGNYFAKNKDWLYDTGKYSPATYAGGPADQAFADFVRVATVDSRDDFARWALNGGPQQNTAEQNANWLINKVGKDDFDRWSEAMSLTFANIGSEYLDSFVSTLSSPVDVSGLNAPWLAVNASEGTWKKFFQQGMLSDKGLLTLSGAFKAKAGDLDDQLNNEVSKGQHAGTNNTSYLDPDRATAWLRYARNQLQVDFGDALTAADDKVNKDYQDRVDGITGLVSKGLDWLTDPKGIPKDIESMATGAVKDWVAGEVGGLLAGKKPQLPGDKISIDDTALDSRSDYANDAIAQYNDGLAAHPEQPWAGSYNDGDVHWDGKPSLYEDPKHPFTNPDGSVKSISEIKNDPQALQAFVQWLQDPNVQSHVAVTAGRPN